MADISIRSVKKSYGATMVIHGVSVDIRDGEFAVIVGPSGCGKSTLLRMIAGLERITEGEIAIGGTLYIAAELFETGEHWDEPVYAALSAVWLILFQLPRLRNTVFLAFLLTSTSRLLSTPKLTWL